MPLKIKTRADVEKLKQEWKEDPCWDIEETEGFEEYRNELKEFHERCRSQWEADKQGRLFDKSVQIGVPGNLVLATHIEYLESQITALAEKVQKLENET